VLSPPRRKKPGACAAFNFVFPAPYYRYGILPVNPQRPEPGLFFFTVSISTLYNISIILQVSDGMPGKGIPDEKIGRKV